MGGGWLLLRNSPLVSVERVRVIGVHGASASAIESALGDAARHMSTLDVHIGALRAAVARYPVVRDLRVSSSFPHGLRIRVIEQLPVAALTVGGARTAVAADGVVLGPALLSGSLPAVAGTTVEPVAGQRVGDAGLLADLAVLGVAPAPLAHLTTRVYMGPKGLTVTMHNGLQVYFGDASTPRAKWLSLARVLADPSSAGASYVDVRLPERAAAGFPNGAPSTTEGAGRGGSALEETSSTQGGSASTAERGGGSESTTSALAAGLKGASGNSEPTSSAKESESKESESKESESKESEAKEAEGKEAEG
jgi:cell division protein FtsQ